jgi:cytochrome d ubiquinol oxidase subunit I
VPVDWLAVIFNPSFPYRLLHMTVAAFLSSALFVGCISPISAWTGATSSVIHSAMENILRIAGD